jgi:hypothetical protein
MGVALGALAALVRLYMFFTLDGTLSKVPRYHFNLRDEVKHE